ncbi:hypothetical protein F4774DRAFT_104650 [Daldinia eschscholtzii]|nr:hypothetical protein F4774DRAFT_104650 [Daldinia eschscholtzii]
MVRIMLIIVFADTVLYCIILHCIVVLYVCPCVYVCVCVQYVYPKIMYSINTDMVWFWCSVLPQGHTFIMILQRSRAFYFFFLSYLYYGIMNVNLTSALRRMPPSRRCPITFAILAFSKR